MNMLLGMKVVVSPDHPKYTLPKEVIPGVPWPAGFREQINEWSASFLGTYNMAPEHGAYIINDTIIVRPEVYAQMKRVIV